MGTAAISDVTLAYKKDKKICENVPSVTVEWPK